jgi:short-subunit dehydrogenase
LLLKFSERQVRPHDPFSSLVLLFFLLKLYFLVLITGPSEQGIGAQTAIDLAAGKPKLILLAGRDQAKIQPVIDQIAKSHPDVATEFISLNLASLASIRQTAEKINSRIESLDILINNAGGKLFNYFQIIFQQRAKLLI